MSSQQFERFRMRARNVTLPENVRESVIDEIRVEKGERVRSSRQGRGAGSPVTRRFIVTAGLGSLGIAAGYLALSVAARPDPAEPAEGVRATEPEGNFFALAAYADGTPYGDSTVIAKQMVGSAGAYGGSPGLYWYAARTLNFDVAGTSIEKISYALEGEVVGFPEGGAEGVPLDRPYAYFDALYNRPDQVEGGEAHPDHGGTPDSFTVDYASQERDQDDFNRQIWTYFPADAKLDELHRQMDALLEVRDGTYESELAYMRASNAFWSAVERRSVKVLAQITLALTATFENGETKTKRYTIGIRDDYDDAIAAFDEKEAELSALMAIYRDDPDRQAEYEAAYQDWQEFMKSRPDDLFTLTELT